MRDCIKSSESFLRTIQKERDVIVFSLLSHIPNLINERNNEILDGSPDSEEVKDSIFKINGDSSSGPDRFICRFYQV